MRLATITNWAYGATVVLTLASGTAMLLASSAQEKQQQALAARERGDDDLARRILFGAEYDRELDRVAGDLESCGQSPLRSA